MEPVRSYVEYLLHDRQPCFGTDLVHLATKLRGISTTLASHSMHLAFFVLILLSELHLPAFTSEA